MLKILAFADMHGSMKAFKKIEKNAKNADILLCAGDISIFENDLKKILKRFNKLGVPMIVISGNHESDESLLKHTKDLANVIHKKDDLHSLGNYHFLCSSGDGFAQEDKQFEKTAKRLYKNIKKITANNKDAKFILLTHAPPHKTKQDTIMGGHCGNKAIRRFIMKTKPNLAICGHIHENAGKKDTLGKTKVINPGPFGKILKV